MSEKKIKKCGRCGKEIKDDKYLTVWNATENKLIAIFCKKCYIEDKKLTEHIRKILS
jgi:NMD protein affecting ribosome stability and mRNA decay